MKTNMGRKRININGALSIQKKEVIIEESETINAQSTINLFTKILSENKKAKSIYIISDNAKYYHAQVLNEWLLNNSKIKMIFLPSYSPNLNLIERLWKFFHKKVTCNKYYEKFTLFRREVLMFFNTIKYKWDELETLLTENFQITGSV